jgi:hypothetical protein
MMRRMRVVREKWQHRSTDALICSGCLERVISKILRRAELEEAGTVILEQEGEDFFHQWYIAVVPVHVIEPSHSLGYKTILKAMSEAATARRPLKPGKLKVVKAGPKQFRLTGSGVELILRFR